MSHLECTSLQSETTIRCDTHCNTPHRNTHCNTRCNTQCITQCNILSITDTNPPKQHYFRDTHDSASTHGYTLQNTAEYCRTCRILQHTLQHTLQHILQHTMQHTLQLTLQHTTCEPLQPPIHLSNVVFNTRMTLHYAANH